jgi:hypothetical protein
LKKVIANESPGISFAKDRGSSGKIGLAPRKAISQAGGEAARKARPLRHRPRVALRLSTKRRMDRIRSGNASGVCIASAENQEMGYDFIERLFVGKVTKYIDYGHRDPRVTRTIRPSGTSAAPAAARCE